jgi:hypothetical protein
MAKHPPLTNLQHDLLAEFSKHGPAGIILADTGATECMIPLLAFEYVERVPLPQGLREAGLLMGHSREIRVGRFDSDGRAAHRGWFRITEKGAKRVAWRLLADKAPASM